MFEYMFLLYKDVNCKFDLILGKLVVILVVKGEIVEFIYISSFLCEFLEVIVIDVLKMLYVCDI